jgi:hypothetical protein
MPKGRPPELVLDPNNPGPAAQAAIALDERGRVQLPRKIIDPLAWISKNSTTETLAVFANPGVIRLHSWAKAAPAILEKRQQLIEHSPHEDAALEMLRALEDRYKRFQIPFGARPTLTNEMLVHLGLPLDEPSSVYVWRVNDVLEFNSIEYRNTKRDAEWDRLADLPH